MIALAHMTDSGPSAERVLQLVEPTLVAFLLLKLIYEQLQRRYRYFTLYLLASITQSVTPIIFGWRLDTSAYSWFYALSEPVMWSMAFLLVMELFDLVLAEFPGIRSAARLIVKILAPISIAVSAATALPSVFRIKGPAQVLRMYFVAQRTITIELLLLLGAVQFVLLRYRLTLPRNTIFYSIGYALFFTAFAVQAGFISEGGPTFVQITNVVGMSVSCGCLVFWTLMLNRRGESIEIAAGPKVSENEKAELRARLTQVSEFFTRLRSGGNEPD